MGQGGQLLGNAIFKLDSIVSFVVFKYNKSSAIIKICVNQITYFNWFRKTDELYLKFQGEVFQMQ